MAVVAEPEQFKTANGSGERRFATVNPATGEVVQEYPFLPSDQVTAVVEKSPPGPPSIEAYALHFQGDELTPLRMCQRFQNHPGGWTSKPGPHQRSDRTSSAAVAGSRSMSNPDNRRGPCVPTAPRKRSLSARGEI